MNLSLLLRVVLVALSAAGLVASVFWDELGMDALAARLAASVGVGVGVGMGFAAAGGAKQGGGTCPYLAANAGANNAKAKVELPKDHPPVLVHLAAANDDDRSEAGSKR